MQGPGAPWGVSSSAGSASSSAARRTGPASSSAASPAQPALPPPVGLARYVKINKVGAGAYGDVFKARDSVTGEIVALKRIKLCSSAVAGVGGGAPSSSSADDGFSSSPGGGGSFADDEDGVPATALREVMALREMGAHPNVVRLLDVIFDLGGAAAVPPVTPPASASSSGSRSSSGQTQSSSRAASAPPLLRPPHLYLVFEYVDRDLRKLLVEEQAAALRRERADAEERARRASGLPASAPSTGAASSSSAAAGLHQAGGGGSGSSSAPSPASAGLPPIYLRSFLWQLLRGLAAMHARRLVHRDLKPANILVDRASGVLRIADLGLARAYGVPPRQYTHEVVTLWYRCPEVLLGSPAYTPAVDVWSAGCIFAEMASSRPLWDGECELGQLMRIFRTTGTPVDPQLLPAAASAPPVAPSRLWPGVSALPDWMPAPGFPRFPGVSWKRAVPSLDAAGCDLLGRMLTLDPAQRISAADALAHPFFWPDAATVSVPHPLAPATPTATAAAAGGAGAGAGNTSSADDGSSSAEVAAPPASASRPLLQFPAATLALLQSAGIAPPPPPPPVLVSAGDRALDIGADEADGEDSQQLHGLALLPPHQRRPSVGEESLVVSAQSSACAAGGAAADSDGESTRPLPEADAVGAVGAIASAAAASDGSGSAAEAGARHGLKRQLAFTGGGDDGVDHEFSIEPRAQRRQRMTPVAAAAALAAGSPLDAVGGPVEGTEAPGVAAASAGSVTAHLGGLHVASGTKGGGSGAGR